MTCPIEGCDRDHKRNTHHQMTRRHKMNREAVNAPAPVPGMKVEFYCRLCGLYSGKWCTDHEVVRHEIPTASSVS